MPGATFGKSRRLLKSSEFSAVFADNCFRVSRPQFLILARPYDGETTRLGLVIGKKNISTAVQRNRIKRLARESFRLQKFDKPLDVIFLARRGADQLDNSQLLQLMQGSWRKLNNRAVSDGLVASA